MWLGRQGHRANELWVTKIVLTLSRPVHGGYIVRRKAISFSGAWCAMLKSSASFDLPSTLGDDGALLTEYSTIILP